MSQSKTPYELRADLLVLAFQILEAQHRAKAVADGGDKVKTSATTEEVIAEAEKLNDFVSSSKRSR